MLSNENISSNNSFYIYLILKSFETKVVMLFFYY